MELLNKEFPDDCDVVVRRDAASGTLRVVVRSRRPDPVWLAKYRAPGVPWSKVSAEELRSCLLAAVVADPGRAFSHYSRLPIKEGGVGGSQERKEKLLRDLINEGCVVERPLPKPVGRKTHGIWPAGLPSEETQAIMSV